MKYTALFLFCMSACGLIHGQQRAIAFTIDDLPVVSTRQDIQNRQEITKKLLKHLADHEIPAVGFVNENNLYREEGECDQQQVDLLKMWLDAGLELGNHTFSHTSLHKITVEEFQQQMIKGETITNELLLAKHKKMRYFRHPYLHTGTSLDTKADMDKFFSEKGYIVAPVTIDFEDYVFSSAYDRAFDKGDRKLMRRIGKAYVEYMDKMTAYWERQSRHIFGREISQILLIHANFINSDYLDDVAERFEKRGYRTITLEEALKDPAYREPDLFTGDVGISWLHRWAIKKGGGNVLANEPKIPLFVVKASVFGKS